MSRGKAETNSKRLEEEQSRMSLMESKGTGRRIKGHATETWVNVL